MRLDLAALSGIAMFLVSLGSLIILMKARVIGKWLAVMDYPDSIRKKHGMPTPLVGGLAIMLPFCIWATVTLLWDAGASNASLLCAVLLCGAGATLVGYADDQSSTTPSSRLLFLVLLTITALVIDPRLVPAQINWGSFSPTLLAPSIAFLFVSVAMAGLVNAINMADGQNGIALGMYVIWAICLMLVGHGADVRIVQTLFMTAAIVLLFNLAGKVFLGDAGTYGITFVFGLLAIVAHNRWGVTAETIAVWFFIPVVDCIRLIISRAIKGKAPSQADRDHFHHRLEGKLGKTTGLGAYLGVVALSSFVSSLAPQLALVCMVVLAAFYFSFAWLTVVDDVENTASEGADAMRVAATDTNKVVKLGARDAADAR